MVCEHAVCEHKIYTLGYGRTKKHEFQQRIRGMPFRVIFDLRREGSGSRNGKWCWQGEEHIGMTIRHLQGIDMRYIPVPELANEYGNTRRGLALYTLSLRDRKADLEELATHIAWMSSKGEYGCLMCAERRSHTPSGKPACHRVLVAEILAESISDSLGQKWSVEHV
jgi:hypothetical protein